MGPYRIPATQEIPEPLDFAYVVFATNAHVIAWARTKFEVQKDPENVLLKRAVLRLWHISKGEAEKQRAFPNAKKTNEALWYEEARILADRVGKRWDTTPIPTLVEALSNDEMLHPIGFPTVLIPAGAMMQVFTQPQVCVRPRRLVLGPEEVANALALHDLKVGKNSMFCNSSGIPGACFSEKAFPFRLDMDTCPISQRISLYLENQSSLPVSVTPCMFGVVRRGDR